jgi:hypothetical protein
LKKISANFLLAMLLRVEMFILALLTGSRFQKTACRQQLFSITKAYFMISRFLLAFLLISSVWVPVQAQTKGNLFFREDWKEIPAATPVTQEHVANPNLLLSLHGPGKDKVKKSFHPEIPNDPYYIWSGECLANWALSLRHRNQLVDLSGPAALVRWRARQSGFRELRLLLKLADGTWLVSDQSHPFLPEWGEKEFRIADLRWRKLNLDRVIEGNWVDNPDLTRVEEIGFTDLMAGGQTPASSRLD